MTTSTITLLDKFKAHPVPLSTFLPPPNVRTSKEERTQRAIRILALSKEPGHMADHSIRWKVQQKVRHVPKCFIPKEILPRIRSKSVPDFRRLHRDFELKLDNLRQTKPITLPEPFQFNEDYPKHYCKVSNVLSN